MEKSKTITLWLEAREVTFKKGKKETTFTAFKTPIGGLNVDVKFTKDVDKIPVASGYVTLNVKNININTEKEYPVLWIREL